MAKVKVLLSKKERLLAKLQEEKDIAAKSGETVSVGHMDDFKDTNLENYILTGVLGIDLNINGIKKGAISVFYGAESSGKSSTALTVIEGICLSEPEAVVLYVDTEQTVNQQFASRNPYLNLDNVIFLKESEIETAFDKVKEYLNEDLVDYVVFDSIDATYAKAEFEKNLEDKVMMEKARVLSRALPQISELIAQNQVGMILIQQLRTKMTAYGASDSRSGGNAMKFFPSSVLKFSKDSAGVEKNSEGDINRMFTIIKNEKSKVSRPYMTTFAYINTNPNEGISIDRVRDCIAYSKEAGLIDVAGGGWVTLAHPATGELIVKIQGENKLSDVFKKDLDLYSMFKMKVYSVNLPGELFITKYDHIKALLETENRVMKERLENEIKLQKGLNKSEIAAAGFNIEPFTFSDDFKPENLMEESVYKISKFNLASTEEQAKILKNTEKEIKDREKKEKQTTDESNVLEGIGIAENETENLVEKKTTKKNKTIIGEDI